MAFNAEVAGIGRGVAFNQVKKIQNDEDGVALEIDGERKGCMLLLTNGLVKDNPDAVIPFLLFTDGSSGIALLFEEQDENGEWYQVDLAKLVSK